MCEKPFVTSQQNIHGSISCINIFVCQLHMFIVAVHEMMSRVKMEKSSWVKARKKPEYLSQTLKKFDEEWQKNLPETDKGSHFGLHCLPGVSKS